MGEYDYAFLFKPNIPFLAKERRTAPFFGLNDRMPLFLGLLLGLQHALAMLAGIVTPPLQITGSSGAKLTASDAQYVVSTALIVSGLLTVVQITRIHIWRTPYYLGTGLISVVGTSFGMVPVATATFSQMYANGFCPTAADGTPLPCRQAYGALIGTSLVCSLFEMLISFLPPKALQKIFPPLVTGPTVTLIGMSLVASGFEGWAGGSGPCMARPTSGPNQLCPSNTAPHALPWGSAQFIGLGFASFVTIILCERFGSPIMRSSSVVIGLLVGSIIASATGYFDHTTIDAAPVASFIWTHTFPLSVYGPAVLPTIAVYLVNIMEAIGDITATCDVSRLEVAGKVFDSRIQGGILADGFSSLLSGLATITPMAVFAQNNGVIALTRCASRRAGYFACFWLVVMGIFAKFGAALVAIPAPVLGGVTTFLFGSVAISGIRIISTIRFTGRNRFVLTAAVAPGIGAIIVPKWFSYFFTYTGNDAKAGLIDAVVIVMETGFTLTAFLGVILNLLIPEDEADDTLPVLEQGSRGTDESSLGVPMIDSDRRAELSKGQ